MTILQKISLSIMVVMFLFCGIFGLAVKGADIDSDDKNKRIFTKGFTYNFLGFVFSTIVFMLGFIWR